jgi:hypothetical protein
MTLYVIDHVRYFIHRDNPRVERVISVQLAVQRGNVMAPVIRPSIKTALALFALNLIFSFAPICKAQDHSQTSAASSDEMAGTSTDFYVMLGTDFVRPGLLPKANYNIGIGHTFGFLKKDPICDELTFAYTYEDAGSGFWHSDFGSHTESFGVMKNFGLPKTKMVTGYTWIQVGISTFTGNAQLQNHFYNGESLGAVVHFTEHHSLWIQETFNKIVTAPWYTTTSIGYTRSW